MSEPLRLEVARDTARRLRRFTITEFCQHIGYCRQAVTRRLDELERRGMLVREAEKQKHRAQGRPATVYVFVRPTGGLAARPRVEPPEVVMMRAAPKVQRARPVAGAGRRRGPRVKDPVLKALVKAATEHPRWKVEYHDGSHVRFLLDGEVVDGVSVDGSDWRAVKNLRAGLRSAGLPV